MGVVVVVVVVWGGGHFPPPLPEGRCLAHRRDDHTVHRGLSRLMATLHCGRWAVGYCGSLAAKNPGCLNGRTWRKKKREIKQKRRTEENSICKKENAQEAKKKRGDQRSRSVSVSE